MEFTMPGENLRENKCLNGQVMAVERHWMYFMILLIPGLITLGILLPWFAYRLRRFAVDKFLIAPQELYICQGICRAEEYQIALRSIRGFELERGMLGEIFDYGTLHIYVSPAQGERVTFDYVKNPGQVIGMLDNLKKNQDWKIKK